MFPPFFVADTKKLYGYNFVDPLSAFKNVFKSYSPFATTFSSFEFCGSSYVTCTASTLTVQSIFAARKNFVKLVRLKC